MLNLLEPSDGKTIRRLKVGDPPLLAKNVQQREAAAEYKVRQSQLPSVETHDFLSARLEPHPVGCCLGYP